MGENSAGATKRDTTIDGLKLLAAGGIVMVHVAMSARPGVMRDFVGQIAYSSLYFFFIIAGYFHGATGTRGRTWLGRRFVRLGVPYAIWSLIYLVFESFQSRPGHPLVAPDLVRVVFFAGANEVLWSLPWLFACAAIAELLARTPGMRRTLLVASAAVQVAVWVFLPASAVPQFGIRQYIEGGRWLFAYVAGMELRAADRVPGTPAVWTTIAVICSLAAGGLASFVHAQSTVLLPELALFALNSAVAFSMLAGTRAGASWLGARRLGWGGDYLLGIYVSHHLWLELLARFIVPHSLPAWLWIPFAWTVCFSAAVLLTKLLLSNRWTRLAVT